MGRCFVIQPFDGGAFDKRYADTLTPAIQAAGLEPYRVDKDPSVSIPIEDIDAGIRESEACLADITTDNPNVWYEVGAAVAHRRVLVLVCSSERSGPFPFDVQHRNVIRYKTESARDFSELQREITERLKAMLQRQRERQTVADLSPMQETEGLSPHEVGLLVTVAESEQGPGMAMNITDIHRRMESAGFTKIATNLSVASLEKKKLLESSRFIDDNGYDYGLGYSASASGMVWLAVNQDKLVLRVEKTPDDDIPF